MRAGIIALIALMLAAGPAAAEIYKYKDADGNWVFSESPPADPAKAVVVKPRYSGASEDAINRLESDKERAAEMADARRKSEEEEAKAAREAEARKANCEMARSNLAQLEASTRLQYVNEDNERAFLTEEMRQGRMSKARENVAKFCK